MEFLINIMVNLAKASNTQYYFHKQRGCNCVFDLLRSRGSVGQYEDKPVETKKVNLLMEGAFPRIPKCFLIVFY